MKILLKIHNTKLFQKNPSISRSLKKVVSIFLQIVTFNRGLTKVISGMKYKFDYNFWVADYSNWGGDHNSGFKSLLDFSENKMVVFDIGAHIGLCSMPLSNIIDPQGMVYAFEPSLTNRKYLNSNIKYNKIENIIVIPSLVGDKSKDNIEFFESLSVSGMNSVVNYKKSNLYKSFLKEQVSLDDFCHDNDLAPDVIKIDVEGAEIDVLLGANKIIEKCKPIIILSAHPRHLKLLGKTVDDLIRVIYSLNYKIFDSDKVEVDNMSLNEYILLPE
jgi:FkbM family methyltransferase